MTLCLSVSAKWHTLPNSVSTKRRTLPNSVSASCAKSFTSFTAPSFALPLNIMLALLIYLTHCTLSHLAFPAKPNHAAILHNDSVWDWERRFELWSNCTSNSAFPWNVRSVSRIVCVKRSCSPLGVCFKHLNCFDRCICFIMIQLCPKQMHMMYVCQSS